MGFKNVYHDLVSAANDVLLPFRTINFSQLGEVIKTKYESKPA